MRFSIAWAAVSVKKNFFRRRDLLPQTLQQGISRNAYLPTDTDTSYLAAADQLVGGVAADAKDGHQVLYPQNHGEVS